MVLVQKWPFFQLFFLGNIGQEDILYDILELENAFLGYKNNRVQKVQKIKICPKRLTHGFGSKMDTFQTLFFRQYRQVKCVLQYSRTKKTPFFAIKTRSSKS